MAISGGDGSIILTTTVDTSGIDKGESKIKNAANRMANAFKGVGVQLTKSTSQSKDVAKLQKEFDKTNATIEETKRKMDELAQKADKIRDSAFQGPAGELVYTQSQEKEISKIDIEYNKLNETLTKSKIKAEELEVALSQASKGNLPAVKAVTKGVENFGKRIASLVKRVFIFSVILRALRALLNILKNVAMGDEEFVESLNELKAALWVAFTPILNIVIPALKTLMNWLTQVAVMAGRFFAIMAGKSYNSIVEQAKGFKSLAKGAKEAKKQLAGFDDIQILQNTEQETALSDDFFEKLKTPEGEHTPTFAEQLSSIIAGVGLLIAAIGLVLLFKTKLPLAHSIGIGMIVAGAGIFAVGAVQMAANNIGGDIGNMLHGIIVVASGFMLAIGLILLFSGVINGLSIGLVVASAVGLVSEIALYPDAIKEALQGWVGGVLAIVSGALLVLGIVLVACGIVTPLTIGMIVAGAVGLAGVVAVNRDAIVDWVKGAWDAVKNFWDKYIAPVFTAKFWLDLAKKCGNGLIAGFEGAINGIIGMFESMINWIVDGLNSISIDVPDWVPAIGGSKFGFNIPRVSFGRVSIPRLAQGAVIPPNREFLAVLGDQKHGTNIEAPLQTIVDAFNIALAQNGGARSDNTEIILEIDGREFGRAVVEQGNRESRRIGTRLAVV